MNLCNVGKLQYCDNFWAPLPIGNPSHDPLCVAWANCKTWDVGVARPSSHIVQAQKKRMMCLPQHRHTRILLGGIYVGLMIRHDCDV